MKIKKVTAIIALAAAAVVSVCSLIACNDGNNSGGGNGGNNNGGGNNGGQNMSVLVYVRDVDFAPLTENVYYDGKEIGTSAAEPVTVTVAQTDELVLTSKVAIDGPHITYVDGFKQDVGTSLVIIKTDKPVEEFYSLMGKTVYAADGIVDGKEVWSGETAAPGVEIRIGSNVLPRESGDERNFGFKMVHKDSVITAYKEGCAFVDMSFQPYNDICFADMLKDCTDTEEVVEKGKKVNIKALGGVTFRLDNR